MWFKDQSKTDASRFGTLEIVFESNDKPQFLPGPLIHKARRILKDFGPEDYLLWSGGGDPVAVMICSIVAAEVSPVVRLLRWERNRNEGVRDRRKGWYMPLSLEFSQERSEIDS